MNALRRGAVLMCVCTVAAMTAAAQPNPNRKTLRVEPKVAQSLMEDAVGEPIGTKWALLIGINQYAHPDSGGFRIDPLKVAVRDVETLARFLIDPLRAAFPQERVYTLTDEQATKRDILLTLNEIVMKADEKDLVVVYFSGHGYHDANRKITYLLPHDAEMRDPATTCIDLTDLRKKFDELKANKLVSILDACHSGGLKIEGTKAVDESPYEYYVNMFERAEGRPMLLSSDQSEVSWELPDGRNSVFTHFLIKGLDGEADFDGDGVVGFSEVARYVERRVPEYTEANGLTAQRPTRRDTGGQIRGDIPLAFDVDTLAGIRDALDTYAEQLRELRANAATGDDRLSATEIDRVTQYAMEIKERQLRRRRVSPQDFEMIGVIDRLAQGEIDAAAYRAQLNDVFPEGLPTIEDLATFGDGALLVKTEPIGAAIYVDGQFRAYAPKRIDNLPAGRRRVRLVLPGKPAYEQAITVLDDEAVKLNHEW